jgi:hypothetical protein
VIAPFVSLSLLRVFIELSAPVRAPRETVHRSDILAVRGASNISRSIRLPRGCVAFIVYDHLARVLIGF